MSVFFVREKRAKGWRYDFYLEKRRYTSPLFKTKREAMEAEAKRKEEIV